jgi:hypothetical protein
MMSDFDWYEIWLYWWNEASLNQTYELVELSFLDQLA